MPSLAKGFFRTQPLFRFKISSRYGVKLRQQRDDGRLGPTGYYDVPGNKAKSAVSKDEHLPETINGVLVTP